MPESFSARRAKREHDQAAFQAPLYQQMGQLKVALDWLNKNAGLVS
jgi:putative transposase